MYCYAHGRYHRVIKVLSLVGIRRMPEYGIRGRPLSPGAVLLKRAFVQIRDYLLQSTACPLIHADLCEGPSEGSPAREIWVTRIPRYIPEYLRSTRPYIGNHAMSRISASYFEAAEGGICVEEIWTWIYCFGSEWTGQV